MANDDEIRPPKGPWNGEIPEGWERYEGPRIPGLFCVLKQNLNDIWERANTDLLRVLDSLCLYIRKKETAWVYKTVLPNGVERYSEPVYGEKPKFVFHPGDGEWVLWVAPKPKRVFALWNSITGDYSNIIQLRTNESPPAIGYGQFEWVELVPKV